MKKFYFLGILTLISFILSLLIYKLIYGIDYSINNYGVIQSVIVFYIALMGFWLLILILLKKFKTAEKHPNKLKKSIFWISLITFILFTIEVIRGNDFLWELDQKVLISKMFYIFPDKFLYIFSGLSDIIFLSIISAIIFSIYYKKNDLKKARILFLMPLSLTTTAIAKILVGKIRTDFNYYQNYPSGHLISIVSFCYIIHRLYLKNMKNKKIKLLSYFGIITIIFLTTISRMTNNYHWFSGIMGGILLGITVASIEITYLPEPKRIIKYLKSKDLKDFSTLFPHK